MEWETVIGLEIHAQLATNSKIFSGSSTAYGAEPNTQASLIDLGMPGVLPVLNKEAVHFAVKFGLAIDAQYSTYALLGNNYRPIAYPPVNHLQQNQSGMSYPADQPNSREWCISLPDT